MANKCPIFPMPEPQHFSDYGFDPQVDYFQEAMKRRRETARSIDSIHFKLQKPNSKDDSRKVHRPKRKRWWRNAFLSFKRRWTHHRDHHHPHHHHDVHPTTARAFRASISTPVYLIESRSGSSTPYRTTRRPSSGPIAGTLLPPAKGDVDAPYLNLRELSITMEQQQPQQQRMSTSAMPIYLVT